MQVRFMPPGEPWTPSHSNLPASSHPGNIPGNPNEVYQTLCQLYGSLGLEKSVTRIVVLGQQSMGKTTLLNTIMGLPVGFTSSGCGTKCPVEYHLRPGPDSLSVDEYQFRLNGEACTAETLQSELTSLMQNQSTITEDPIKVEIAGRGFVHAMFVDLPGIQVDDEEKMIMSTRVASNYIDGHPMDIFIFVTKADDDYNNRPAPVLRVMKKLNPQHTVHVATHSISYYAKRVNELSAGQILDQVRQMHGTHLLTTDQFTVELYQLAQEDAAKPMSEQKQSMYSVLAERYQQIVQILMKPNQENGAALRELCRRSHLFEMGMALENKFTPTLKTTLKESREVSKRRLRALKAEHLVAQQVYNEITTGNLQMAVEQFIHEFVDRCRKITRGSEDNAWLIEGIENGQCGNTTLGNLELAHEKATALFWSDNYTNETFEMLKRKATKYYKAERKLDWESGQTQRVSKPKPSIRSDCTLGQFVRTTDGCFGYLNRRGPDSTLYMEVRGNQREQPTARVHRSHISSDYNRIQPLHSPEDEDGPVIALESECRILLPLGMSEWCTGDGVQVPDAGIVAWYMVDQCTVCLVKITDLADVREGEFPDEWDESEAPGVFHEGVATIFRMEDAPHEKVYPANILQYEPLPYNCSTSSTQVPTDKLFIDLEPDPEAPFQYICGTGWDSRLITNRAFELVGRFMGFIMSHFEPECKLKKEHLFNLQESRPTRVGAATYDGIIETAVRKNVERVLVPLTELIAASGCVIMTDIFNSAFQYMSRCPQSWFRRCLEDEQFTAKFREILTSFAEQQARKNAVHQEEMLRRLTFDGPFLHEKVRYIRRAWRILQGSGSDPLELENELRSIKQDYDSKCNDEQYLKKTSYQCLESKIRLVFMEKADIMSAISVENFHSDFAKLLKQDVPEHPLAEYLKAQILKTPEGVMRTTEELEAEYFDLSRKLEIGAAIQELEPKIQTLERVEQCHHFLEHHNVDFLMKLMKPLGPGVQRKRALA